MGRIVPEKIDMARLITRNELIERFDITIGGTGWVEKQRSFLKQAATA